jgi:hypothetical protein
MMTQHADVERLSNAISDAEWQQLEAQELADEENAFWAEQAAQGEGYFHLPTEEEEALVRVCPSGGRGSTRGP